MDSINKNIDISKYDITDKKYESLKNKYQNTCYAIENEEIGNVCLLVENFFPKKIDLVEFFHYLIYICIEALSISKKYGKPIYNAHVYCKNCAMENISIKKFSLLNDTLGEVFADRLQFCYIYVKSKIFYIAFPLLFILLDPETQLKMKVIKQK